MQTHEFSGRAAELHGERLISINMWMFTAPPKHPDFVCSRHSGAHDYMAEWWATRAAAPRGREGRGEVSGYTLHWVAYHELEAVTDDARPEFVRQHGEAVARVSTLQDVLWYCASHMHPALPL